MTKEWQEAANERAVEQKMDPFTVRLACLGLQSAVSSMALTPPASSIGTFFGRLQGQGQRFDYRELLPFSKHRRALLGAVNSS